MPSWKGCARPSTRTDSAARVRALGAVSGCCSSATSRGSERRIAWRVADSLSLRTLLHLDVTEATPNHSTLSRTRRLIDVETHVAVFTWVLERLAEAGLVKGKTVRKRVLMQAAGCNLGLLLRHLTRIGTPRSLQGRALSAILGLIGRLIELWERLTLVCAAKWTPAGLVRSTAHRQAA